MGNRRYALRLLAKSPGFTLIAILTLALGIGVNSGIFSIINAVMLRPLPYSQPQQLVSIWETLTGEPPMNWSTHGSGGDPRVRMPVSAANFVDYVASARSLILASYETLAMNLPGNGTPERIAGERLSDGFFSVLGVSPAQGRAFLPEEDRAGADRVVIVTHEFWERRLGSDPNWSSASVTLEGEKYRIVGIMPPDFQAPGQIADGNTESFFLPGAYSAAVASDHGTHQIRAIARLRPGSTIERAQAELDAISARLTRQFPDSNQNLKTAMQPLSSDLVRSTRASLLVMLGAVGLVLLIACANLANLLLARAVARQREITIRLALGASRARVIGELLTQSLVLAVMGSMAGLALGIWTRELLMKMGTGQFPRLASASLDARVLLFTLALSLVTGLAFGIFPALQVSKCGAAESLKSTERGSAGTGVMRWRNTLMLAEVSLAMILLVGAGLL